MSDSGWITHPKYGQVYQPDLTKARMGFHSEYDAWYGEEHDTMDRLIDHVQYAAMRTVLNDLRFTLLVAADDRQDVVRMIDAMQERIDDHQHGEKS